MAELLAELIIQTMIKLEKQYRFALKNFTFVTIVLFLSGCLISASFNPFEWLFLSRSIIAGLWVLSTYLIWFTKPEEK